jgi:TRAP-type uncharacterized transport system substrate-binding protein
MRVYGAVQVGLFVALLAAAWIGGQGTGSIAQTRQSITQNESENVNPRKESAPRKEAGISTSENEYTAGLVTGAPQSTEFAIAQEMATVLATGQETGPHGEIALRVMPMVGNGGTRNILDVLTLAGADMAVAPVVLADRLPEARTRTGIRSKLVYIAPLFAEEFHLLARSDVASLSELSGKRVNLGEQGSAAAVLGRELFNALDVKISEVNLGIDVALDEMRNGNISATLLVSGKPVKLLTRYAPVDGIHFLPIPTSPGLQQDYLPSSLGHQDYPNIIGIGESVNTIAIQSALFAYNWPTNSPRYRLLELFVQTLFSRFSEFLSDAHHPKWREVNLAAPLPGWERFRPAERWLKRQYEGEAAVRNALGRALEQKSIRNPAERDELFQEFLRWRERKHGK